MNLISCSMWRTFQFAFPKSIESSATFCIIWFIETNRNFAMHNRIISLSLTVCDFCNCHDLGNKYSQLIALPLDRLWFRFLCYIPSNRINSTANGILIRETKENSLESCNICGRENDIAKRNSTRILSTLGVQQAPSENAFDFFFSLTLAIFKLMQIRWNMVDTSKSVRALVNSTI